MRWKGIRPHNRGVSMNPVDHPMGGGEGRSLGWSSPVHAVGPEDQGPQDPPQQARPSSSSSAAARSKAESSDASFSKKGPFVEHYLAKKIAAAARRSRTRQAA